MSFRLALIFMLVLNLSWVNLGVTHEADDTEYLASPATKKRDSTPDSDNIFSGYYHRAQESNINVFLRLIQSPAGQHIMNNFLSEDPAFLNNPEAKKSWITDFKELERSKALTHHTYRMIALLSKHINRLIHQQVNDSSYDSNKITPRTNPLIHLAEVTKHILTENKPTPDHRQHTYSVFSEDMLESENNKRIMSTLREILRRKAEKQSTREDGEKIFNLSYQAYPLLQKVAAEITSELRLLFKSKNLSISLSKLPDLQASPQKLAEIERVLMTAAQDAHQSAEFYKSSEFQLALNDLRLALEIYNPTQSRGWLKQKVLSPFSKTPRFNTIQKHRSRILSLIAIMKVSAAKIMAAEEFKGRGTGFSQAYDKLLKVQGGLDHMFTAHSSSGTAQARPRPQSILYDTGKDEIWILSLDGGGIRGVIAATILDEISKRTGKHPSEIFDLFAGTSTGGIIALGLTVPNAPGSKTPKNSTETLLSLYTTQGEKIFPPYSTGLNFMKHVNQVAGFAYKPEHLESAFRQYFENYKLSHAIKPVLVTSVSFSDGQSVRFTSREARNPERNIQTWLAARATSAAPSYFPPISFTYDKKQGVFVDGGITTNDPVYEALIEARQVYPHAKKINILSIGTGEEPYKFDQDAVKTGIGGIALSFLIGMKDGEIKARKQLHFYAQELNAQGISVNYVRINPPLEQKIKLDNVQKANISLLQQLARNIISSPNIISGLERRNTSPAQQEDLHQKHEIRTFSDLIDSLCQHAKCASSTSRASRRSGRGFMRQAS